MISKSDGYVRLFIMHKRKKMMSKSVYTVSGKIRDKETRGYLSSMLYKEHVLVNPLI